MYVEYAIFAHHGEFCRPHIFLLLKKYKIGLNCRSIRLTKTEIETASTAAGISAYIGLRFRIVNPVKSLPGKGRHIATGEEKPE